MTFSKNLNSHTKHSNPLTYFKPSILSLSILLVLGNTTFVHVANAQQVPGNSLNSTSLNATPSLAQQKSVVSQPAQPNPVGQNATANNKANNIGSNMGNIANIGSAGTEGGAGMLAPNPSITTNPNMMTTTTIAGAYPIPANQAKKDIVWDAYAEQVKSVETTPEFSKAFADKVVAEVGAKQLEETQFFIAMDRGFKAQVLALVFFDKEKNAVSISHFTPISTGNTRKLHFITPLGWFENKVENGSYRAEGTKNSQGFRGYGEKGRRVWDFGWQKAQAGWIKKDEPRDIRFQMHATDPALAESKLGTPQSQGCIRVHSTANAFFDKFGIIDKDYEAANYWTLLKTRTPAEFAGNKILVVETGLEAQPKKEEVKPVVKTVETKDTAKVKEAKGAKPQKVAEPTARTVEGVQTEQTNPNPAPEPTIVMPSPAEPGLSNPAPAADAPLTQEIRLVPN